MYVRVEVIPGSKKEWIEETGESRFRASVREPAERNLANRRVQVLIAKWYTVPNGQVRLVSGHHSPRKIFDVELVT